MKRIPAAVKFHHADLSIGQQDTDGIGIQFTIVVPVRTLAHEYFDALPGKRITGERHAAFDGNKVCDIELDFRCKKAEPGFSGAKPDDDLCSVYIDGFINRTAGGVYPQTDGGFHVQAPAVQ